MKPSVYIETTIPSFVVGEVSPILATAAHQITSRRWWEEERDKYRLWDRLSIDLEHEASGERSHSTGNRAIWQRKGRADAGHMHA
jgi:hypothetical protein